MYKDFEFQGSFFLPNHPEQKIYGKLTFNENSAMDIQLDGQFSKNVKNADIILFEDKDKFQFTLFKCNCYGSMIGETYWDAQYSIAGHLFYNVDDLKFNSIALFCDNLIEWIGITGFNSGKRDSIKKRIIEYIPPKPINFKVDKLIKGKFKFNNVKTTYPKHKIGITETVGLIFEGKNLISTQKGPRQNKIESESEIPFLDLIRYSFNFVQFLTIAQYQSANIVSISVESKKLAKLTDPSGLYFPKYFEVTFELPKPSSFKRLYRPLFSYKDIKPKLNKIIPKWYSKLENLEPVFNILLESYSKTNTGIENNFLNMAQALETFHRRTRKNTKLPPKKHDKLLEEVKQKLPKKHYSFFRDRFHYSNEPTLHTRLEELLNEFNFDTLNKLITDKKKFIKNIKDSRNYYTHYGETLEKTRLKGAELYYLTEKMRILLIACVLKEIGFTLQEIEKLFKKSEHRIYHLYNTLI